MIENVELLFSALEGYIIDAKFSSLDFWLYPFGSLIAVLLLTKIWLSRQDNITVYKTIMQLNLALVKAASILGILIVGIACYLWNIGFYKETNLELSHLISLITVLSLIIYGLSQIAKSHSKNGLKNLVSYPLSRYELDKFANFVLTDFKKVRLWILVPLIGFVIFFLIKQQDQNLVSIVIDTSGSMQMANVVGEIPLETGKEALSNTIKMFGDKTDVIITSFEEGNYKQSIADITSSNMESLSGLNDLFYGNDKDGLLNYIQTLGLEDSGSPICETIWKNFLFTKQQMDERSYDNIASIIITDGEEAVSFFTGGFDISNFFCSDPSYNEFFEPETVSVIDLGTGDNAFIQKAEECGFAVEDGTNMVSYTNALDNILRDFKNLYYFIYWLIIICVIFIIIAFIITPKPIRR